MSVTRKATGLEIVFTAKAGTEAITGGSVAVTIPSGLTLLSSVASAGSYAGGTWTIGSMAADAEETLTLLFNVDLSGLPYEVTGVFTYNETRPDKADDTSVKEITLAMFDDQDMFPVRTLTDSGSPHDVLVGIDRAIKLDGTSGAVDLNLGDPAAWIYPDGHSYEVEVTCINAANLVTLKGGTDDIVDDKGNTAPDRELKAGESVTVASDGTDFQIIESGGALTDPTPTVTPTVTPTPTPTASA